MSGDTEKPSERLASELTVEDLFRQEALANAVRHRLKEETPEQVVAAAEKYFKFLMNTKAV